MTAKIGDRVKTDKITGRIVATEDRPTSRSGSNVTPFVCIENDKQPDEWLWLPHAAIESIEPDPSQDLLKSLVDMIGKQSIINRLGEL